VIGEEDFELGSWLCEETGVGSSLWEAAIFSGVAATVAP
jgi:hypothetical protein